MKRTEKTNIQPIEQLNLFETDQDIIFKAISTVEKKATQADRKLFAEMRDLKMELEFLSLKMQMWEEEKDCVRA